MRLMDKVKIVDSWVLSAGNEPITVIKLAKNAPSVGQYNMAIDDDLLEMVYISGGHLDI